MKRAGLIIGCLLLLLLTIPFLSCVTDTTTPAAPAFATTAQLTALQTDLTAQINAKQALIDQKATTAYVDQKVAAIPGATNVYTKAEVDAAIAAAVTAMKADQSWIIKGTGTTTNPAIPTTGQVTWSLWKDVTSPVYIEGDYTWWLQVINGFTEYKKFFVSITMAPGVSGGTGDIDENTTYFYAPDLPARPTDTTPVGGKFSMNFVPASGTAITSLLSGNSQGYAILKGNSEIVIPITLHLDYTTGVTQFTEIVWNVTALNYP